jgi:hypothetical protein
MERRDSTAGGPSASGLIIAVLVGAGALFVTHRTLESSRPAQPEIHLEQRTVPQDVDARLWQDPIAAVALAREQAPKAAAGDPARTLPSAHSSESVRLALVDLATTVKPKNLFVMAVMVNGGPYAEQAESRRRMRYAVLAALRARGFMPYDNEHLGYLVPEDQNLPRSIPFERFESKSGHGIGDRHCDDCMLLLLWLDSSSFERDPLTHLSTLAKELGASASVGPMSQTKWLLLGPASSKGLHALVDDAKKRDPAEGPFIFRIYSEVATVPDAELLPHPLEKANDTVSDYVSRNGVSLLRTIGTDDALIDGLMRELNLRILPAPPTSNLKVKCPSRSDEPQVRPRDAAPASIALISEWDTEFGHTLRQQFRLDELSRSSGYCFTAWHYLRGLDGQLPGQTAPSAAASSPSKGTQTHFLGVPDARGYSEPPEGQSQFDYIRRLAERIRDEDSALRRRYGPESGIRAVGVLGSDVYDKLLVLQALHNELPHAIFFTTDVDVSYVNPQEQGWSRNLIVASHFALRLADPLQRGYAPFRDSQQTAAYTGTLIALTQAEHDPRDATLPQRRIYGWFVNPRIFEVTRSGLFDFSAPTTAMAGDCAQWSIERCGFIHPTGSPMVPDLTWAARFAVAAPLTLVLWAPMLATSRNAKRRLRRFVARGEGRSVKRWHRATFLGVIGVVLAVAPAVLVASYWPDFARVLTEDGKPLYFVEGISPWPTFAIRIATFVLSLYFAVRAWSAMSSNVDRIARDFRLGHTRRKFREALAQEEKYMTRWQRIASIYSMHLYPERLGVLTMKQDITAPATAFWKQYLVQNRASARVLRTTTCVVIMFGLGLVVASALGDAPTAPQRGQLSKEMHHWTTLPAALAIQFLIFFVADATVLTVRMVSGLRVHHGNWPQRTLDVFQARTGIAGQYLNPWIDLQFLAFRTRCIGGLVYYPFIVLSMMLLARSAFFDHWVPDPSLTVIAGLSYAIVLLCAVALRLSVEASRTEALRFYDDAMLRARGNGDAALAEQFCLLRDRIAQLSDGAFAPYSQQPLLKAILLPLLTVGGSSIADYLGIFNI